MSIPLIRAVGTAPEEALLSVAAALAVAGLGTNTEADAAPGQTLVICLDAEDDAVLKPTYQHYDLRYIWTRQSSVVECVAAVRAHVTGSTDPKATAATTGRFASTRGGEEGKAFLSVVREGLASDGGLFMLKSIPTVPPSQLAYLCQDRSLLYVEVAQMVLERLVGGGITPATLYPLVLLAYDESRWSGRQDVCPVRPLLVEKHATFPLSDVMNRWMNNVSVMELFHGPTAAFKDFALQLFPRYFQAATEDEVRHLIHENIATAAAAATTVEAQGQPSLGETHPALLSSAGFAKDQYMILAATSGDTGVAAISGFVNAGGRAKVMILYPMHGVSPVQQLQMLSFDDGKKVEVFGLEGNFDFCQETVKTIFSDNALKEKLAARTPPLRLSSANSINWGRLIPQVVYYFWTYRQHVQQVASLVSTRKENWSYGDVIDVVVPCGNFGNILAAYFAKKMGLPLRKLIVASNKNDVLCDFVETGCYDIRGRDLTLTASPSIDILKASNVERLLYLLTDGDTAAVTRMMGQLETEGHFELSEAMKATLAETFTAGHCTEEECGATIQAVFEASGHTRLLDPHTAVAVFVAKEYRRAQYCEADLDPTYPVPPLVVASTAHWAKFPEPVLHAIKGEAMTLGEPAATPADAVQRVRELFAQVVEAAGPAGKGHVAVHPALSAAIEAAEKSSTTPRSATATVAGVQTALEAFASA